MKSFKCERCDDICWEREPNQAVCLSCTYAESDRANSERAVRQYVEYLNSLRERERIEREESAARCAKVIIGGTMVDGRYLQ